MHVRPRARDQAHVNRCPQLIFICVERSAIIELVDLWLEHPLNNEKKIIPPMMIYMCPGREIAHSDNFHALGSFPFP